MRLPLRFPFRLMLLGVALAIPAACDKSNSGPQASRTLALDSDPPGCEVFANGTSLGSTPCAPGEAALREAGIDWPEYLNTGNSVRENWQLDTTGIVVEPGKENGAWRKLFFKLPDSIPASQILTTETPWGAMAMVRGLDREEGDDKHPTYRVACMRVLTSNSLSLALTLRGGSKPGEKCLATLACRNAAATSLACFRPQVEIFCGKFDEPAMRHSVLKTALPDSWRFFKEGEENSASLEFDPPANGGDYCVFAVVTLYEQPTGGATYDAVYSNGRMLRVGR